MTEILPFEFPGPARKVPQCANIEILVNMSQAMSIMYSKDKKVKEKGLRLRDINMLCVIYVFSIMRCGGLVLNRIPIGYQCKYGADCTVQHSIPLLTGCRGTFSKIFLILFLLAALA